MQYLRLDNLTDKESLYLYKLRHSKCLNTLDQQCERLELRYKNNVSELAAINYAWCIRERELLEKGAPVFNHQKRLTL